jgi:hypothetical protein
MTETLHHALRAMMQFPVIFFFGWILPSTNKKINSFLKSIMTLQPCGIEKSHMVVSHGQSQSHTGENVRKNHSVGRLSLSDNCPPWWDSLIPICFVYWGNLKMFLKNIYNKMIHQLLKLLCFCSHFFFFL